MNINFLNLLREKLNVGSMRSVYLSAMPGRYRARMDLTELDRIEAKFSERFLENLLTKKGFSMKIRLTGEEKNGPAERKLQYLFSENMNLFREEGISSLALGYPILVKQNSRTKSVMKSPLFIWKLEIARSRTDMNEFIITKNEGDSPEINKVLLMQLLSDDKVNLGNIYGEEKEEEDGVLDYKEIVAIISKINEKIGIGYSEEFKLEKFPETAEELDEKGKEKPFIFYGAVAGLFKRQNEGIIQDFNDLVENFESFKFNVTDRDDFQLNKNTSIATDPSQQNVVETLTDTQYKIIQGPPGTGKSQTLTAIITNALENGANILIVCEKKTALDVIYEKLSELGLDSLTAMLSDPSKDRREIVRRVRELEENLPKVEGYDEAKYDYTVKEYKELKEKYNAHQDMLGENIRNAVNITTNDIILGYLEGKDYKDYYHIDTGRNSIDTIHKIIDTIDRLLGKIGTVEKIGKFTEIYNEKLKGINSYEIFFKETSSSLNELKRLILFIKDNMDRYGKDFESPFGINRLKVSVFSLFNSRMKSIKSAWEEIRKNSEKLESYNAQYFGKSFTRHDYVRLTEELKQFEPMLEEIYGSRSEFISFIDEKKSDKLSVEEEAFIDNFIKYVNEKGIEDRDGFLKASYSYSLIQDSGAKVRSYKDYSVNTEKLMEYDKFIVENQKYRIKKYWSEIRQRALSVMGKGENIKMLYNLRKNAKYGKINTLREIIESNVDFFKDMFPIIMTDPNTCSAVFPLKEGIFDLVVFDEASQLKLEEVLPSLMRGKYKIVSGDIHQMPPSNYFGTEMEQQDGSNVEEVDEESLFLADSESLLDYVNNLNNDVQMSYLDFHYRSKHPKLINFSNAAFYESRLIPMPARNEYSPIEFYRIDGTYKGRRNDDEAERIVDYIFGDGILIDGKLPSIGIVTLNLEQKSNIVNKINAYLRENDNEAVKNRYNELLEKGMFVKNLENVQGDERDLMILSTTFGKTAEGKFIQNYGPLNNQQRGYKLLNVLVTRAKYRFAVFTSIPGEYISMWEEEVTKSGNNGKGIFYAYLAYAQSVASGNYEEEGRILNTLAVGKVKYAGAPYEAVTDGDSRIVQIIRKEAGVYENEEIVKNYRIGGFILPYAVKGKGLEKARTVIDVNTTENFRGKTAYRGIIYRKGMFTSMGYEYKLINMTDYI